MRKRWHRPYKTAEMASNHPHSDVRADLLRGTLDLLILSILQRGCKHGYAIGQTIRSHSSHVLKVESGSLYPALLRLKKKGWVTCRWGKTEANQRARFYQLTREGSWQLVCEASRWTQLVNAIGQVMTGATALPVAAQRGPQPVFSVTEPESAFKP